MSKEIRIELNRSGVGQLLRSQDVADYLMGAGAGVASAAGEEYEVMQGFDRVSVIVKPTTKRAAQDNLERNTLLKAVGEEAGR